jgi:hypothetical protein
MWTGHVASTGEKKNAYRLLVKNQWKKATRRTKTFVVE